MDEPPQASEVSATREQAISQSKEEIIKEAKRIEESTLLSSKGHWAAAHRWGFCHLYLGLPTTVLAAIAAAAWFKRSETYAVAGIISTIVAALSAVSTFLNANSKSAAHLKAGNGYDALQTKVRIFATIECFDESETVLTKRLKDLAGEKEKLNRESPQVPPWAYKIAKKGVAAGEATYEVDANRDLPAPR